MEQIDNDTYSFDINESKELMKKIREQTKTNLSDESLSRIITEIHYISNRINTQTKQIFDSIATDYNPVSYLYAQTDIIDKMLHNLAISLTATALASCSVSDMDSSKAGEVIDATNRIFFSSINTAINEIKKASIINFDDKIKEQYEYIKNKKKIV